MTPGYVVTVTRPVGDVDSQGICEPDPVAVVSRQTVDTLEEARAAAKAAVLATDAGPGSPRIAKQGAVEQAMYMPERGGNIGPLPDGSSISVERVEDGGEG